MQNELAASHPQLDIKILGVNLVGLESGNAVAVAGRTLPMLQDVDANVDGQSDAWLAWNAQWRDLVVVDTYNREVGRVNLTTFDLAQPANYATFKQILIDTAAMSWYPPPATCAAADLNGDHTVNRADLNIITAALGTVVTTPGSGGDLDYDGRVTIRDVSRLREFYGQSCGSGSPEAAGAAAGAAVQVIGGATRAAAVDVALATMASELANRSAKGFASHSGATVLSATRTPARRFAAQETPLASGERSAAAVTTSTGKRLYANARRIRESNGTGVDFSSLVFPTS